ncbi:MAG: protein arginine kinase [Halanaerobium sp.]|nr:protein arginine kinase [Halanaerobium sp.]
MSLKDLIKEEASNWMLGKGPAADVVVSSRIRLARNLLPIPFPNQANQDELEKAVEMIKKAAVQKGDYDLRYLALDQLEPLERQVLVEKHLISPQHASGEKYTGLLVQKDETISIMVNEEDHLRMQVIFPGLQLEDAWRMINQLDDYLEGQLDFAFAEDYGYLTACPTNVGTGMRASVMVHLPALQITDRIKRMLKVASQLGLAVRGIYGEGTDTAGNLFQVSNQVTLGNSEDEIISNLRGVTEQIIEAERNARKFLQEQRSIDIRDKVQRAKGILTHAYKISSEEAMKYISDVRLGIDMDIITDVDSSILSELLVLIRPAVLQKMVGKELPSVERDIQRASLIRKRLNLEG